MDDANELSDFDAGPRSIRVTMLLADAAQVVEGKLYILGGGLGLIGPRPQPVAIALQLLLPWDRANVPHEWLIELLDEDGQPVMAGERPIQMRGRVETGRPAGLRPGTPLGVGLAINLTALRLPPSKRFSFQLSIEGESRPGWQVSFATRPAPPEQPPTLT